jgi:hypothetical protein
MSVALALAAALAVPVAAPPVFVGGDYALTFQTPRKTTICALPSDWVGSNHGTVIFLRPPKRCGGVGYPSSSRGFSDDVPRIEVFYAYWLGDPGTGPPPAAAPSAARTSSARPVASVGLDSDATYATRSTRVTRPMLRHGWRSRL